MAAHSALTIRAEAASQREEWQLTRLGGVLIAPDLACLSPDWLLTFIPGGNNDTNNFKQRSALMPAQEGGLGGFRAFKPIASTRQLSR